MHFLSSRAVMTTKRTKSSKVSATSVTWWRPCSVILCRPTLTFAGRILQTCNKLSDCWKRRWCCQCLCQTFLRCACSYLTIFIGIARLQATVNWCDIRQQMTSDVTQKCIYFFCN